MPSDGADALMSGASRWTERSAGPVQQLSSPPLYGYLLDLDDDLGEELEVRMRFSARQQITARLLDADVGECDLSSWFAVAGDGPGLLIVDGLLAMDTRVADRTITELLGSGDLLQPPGRHKDELVERETVWRALQPTRLALLDGEFAQRVRSWPQILAALYRRTERRSDDLDVMRAISCQPRLEVRLVLLLWHLAARWGRVEPAGLRLVLPLTHRLLGQLVAAERPSVSHALRRLSEAGIVTGTAGDWHLYGSIEAHLESLIERTARLTPHEDGAPRSRQRIA
jgi:CRP/FNR family transcriptional regulator, cyclic AMP receptor protein